MIDLLAKNTVRYWKCWVALAKPSANCLRTNIDYSKKILNKFEDKKLSIVTELSVEIHWLLSWASMT
jgi:hypothetical protein